MNMIPLVDLKAQYLTIKAEIQSAIDEVLEKQHFILGPKVEAFESQIAEYCNTKYAIGVASGSDALLLSMMAIGIDGIEYGDEVITTPYTFFSTAGSISRLGTIPVFVDIDPVTYNISPDLIEAKITDSTKAIIPVHLFGQCAEMEPILELGKKYNLYIIEDAAQAIGATYKGRKAGSMGNLGCLSFFPTKNLGGYGDGGMVITNNAELADKIRMLRVQGSKPKYHNSLIGCNSRLDALQAAILSVKLKYLEGWTESRRKNAEVYNSLFSDTNIVTPYAEPYNYHIYNQYVIRVEGAKRNELKNFLKERGIETEIYYPIPLHLQKCYSKGEMQDLGYSEGDLPESEKAAQETLALPIYAELTMEQQTSVVKAIREFFRR
jgi:dTDP-4-amino-4,6-dideoxygalactose transaminase